MAKKPSYERSLPPMTEKGEPDWQKMKGRPLPKTAVNFFTQEILPNLKGEEKKWAKKQFLD